MRERIDDALMARLRELCAAASHGPWKADTVENIGENWLIGSIMDLGQAPTSDGQAYSQWIVTTDKIHASEMNGDAESDAQLIAAMRNTIPALLDEIARLRGEAESEERGWTILEDVLSSRVKALKADLRFAHQEIAQLRGAP